MPSNDVYPVLHGDDPVYPQCIVCKRSCGEPGEFLVLSAGAVLYDDETRQTGGPDDRMSGYLTLIKHGAEPKGPYVCLELVYNFTGGQADLMFCSTLCMRQFLNSAVDELELRWREG